MSKSAKLSEKQQSFEDAFATGDVDAAGRLYTQLESEQPNEVFTRVAKARLEAAHGNVLAAVMTLRHTVNGHPKSGYARAYYGSLLVADGKFIKAIAELKTAIGQDGDTPAARHSLGVALLQTGKADEAAQHLQNAAARLEQPSTYFYLGQCFEAVGELGKAEGAYEACCTMMPEYEGAIPSLVRAQALQGKFGAAKDTLEAGLRLMPGDLELTRFLVQVNLDLGDHEAARAVLQSMPAGSKTVEDLAIQATLALDEKRWDDALAIADEAEDKDATHWRPPYVRGLALEGKHAARETVIVAYEQAIAAGDPYGEAGTRLGFVLLVGDEADPDAARAVLEDAAERNGGAPGTLLNLAIACDKTGDALRAQELASQVSTHPHARDGDREQAKRLLGALAQ